MTEQDIILKITELQDKATAASRDCVKYMGKEGCTQKYLESLRDHGEATREIKRLKGFLNEMA